MDSLPAWWTFMATRIFENKHFSAWPKIRSHRMTYLIPIKIRTPLIFVHPYFTVNFPFSHSFVAFFLLPLIHTARTCSL